MRPIQLKSGALRILLLYLFSALLLFATAASWAQTPAGTVISNTAHIDYTPGVFTRRTVTSNQVDTVVEASDTDGPVILSASAGPSTVTNGGDTTSFSIAAFDTQGIDTIVIDLSPLGLSESTPFRNDGVQPDTTAGDTFWNLMITVDSTVIGDTYQLEATAIDSAGNQTIFFITLAVIDVIPVITDIISLGDITDTIRIKGNALTLLARHADTVASVQFDYRTAPTGPWTPVQIAQWSESNPVTNGPPWSILWDISALPDAEYHVRATGFTVSGDTDPSPKFIRVIVTDSSPTIEEWNDTANNIHVRRHLFKKNTADTSWMFDGTYMHMPPGALTSKDTVWIRSYVFFEAQASAPEPSKGTGLIVPGDGSYRRFIREDGESLFDDYVIISIPYDTDISPALEETLAIYRYDPAGFVWIEEPGSVVEKDRKFVWVRVRHFTNFAVFGIEPSANLSNVVVYPNPFIPYDGNNATGTSFTTGDISSGIIFGNVTNDVGITIYDIAGRKVASFGSASSRGNIRWDGRNTQGAEVRSGMYIAVIESSDGQRAVRKFMIIR